MYSLRLRYHISALYQICDTRLVAAGNSTKLEYSDMFKPYFRLFEALYLSP
jgi:hypothetical protein